jgi:hypothetical protein
MLTALAITLITVFALLGSVHVYWALGGRIVLIAAVPEVSGKPSFRPGAVLTFAVACALFACAALTAAVAGFVQVPGSPTIVRWCAFTLALVLLLRAIGDFRLVGFFKRVRGSRFAQLDSVIYSPLCLVLAAGVFTVAWHRGA